MPLLSIILIILGSLVYASLFEWILHRFIMHKPFLGFTYPFKAHALTHHSIFKADKTYHLKNEADKKTIPMAWWNAPVLILISIMPTIPFCFLFKTPLISVIPGIVFCLYYGAYEYLHWCMHLPLKQRRVIEKNWIFFRLNGHHLLHHRYPNKNYNVVMPLADLMFSTLMLRSPVCFAQARGPSIPDVQPKQK